MNLRAFKELCSLATDTDMGLAFPNELDIDIVALKIFIYIVCYVAALITSCVNCDEFRHYIQSEQEKFSSHFHPTCSAPKVSRKKFTRPAFQPSQTQIQKTMREE